VNLEEFIKTQIKSVPELRALLFFYAFPQSDWDAAEVARKLFLQPPMAAGILKELVGKGFLAAAGDPPRYRYQPQSAALADGVVQLAQMDRVWPVTLINLITPVAGTSSQVPPLSSSQKEEGP
jgi:hypothetical protein